MNSIRYLTQHNPHPGTPNDRINRSLCWRARHCKRAWRRLAARNELIVRCQGLVYAVAWKFGDRGRRTLDELVSDGQIGLMRAIELFDFDRGYAFASYATVAIRRTMTDGMRDHDRQTRKAFLLDESAAANLPDRESEHTTESERERGELLGRLLMRLDDRQREFITICYGLGRESGKPMPDREAAAYFGVTHQRVCQLRNGAIDRMARALRKERIA